MPPLTPLYVGLHDWAGGNSPAFELIPDSPRLSSFPVFSVIAFLPSGQREAYLSVQQRFNQALTHLFHLSADKERTFQMVTLWDQRAPSETECLLHTRVLRLMLSLQWPLPSRHLHFISRTFQQVPKKKKKKNHVRQMSTFRLFKNLLFPHTIHKNKPQMGERLTCKTWNHTWTGIKHRWVSLCNLDVGKVFSNYDSKSRCNKENIELKLCFVCEKDHKSKHKC